MKTQQTQMFQDTETLTRLADKARIAIVTGDFFTASKIAKEIERISSNYVRGF